MPAPRRARLTPPARWGADDLAALDAVPALGGPELPWSEWSMRPSALAAAIAAAPRTEHPNVVELGAGPSTVVLARWARERGGRLVSAEHDPEWAGAIRDLLAREGLDTTATVVDAPLRPLPAPALTAPPGFELARGWYERSAVRAACPRIGLLVVDGPPGGALPAQLVRAPAVPALRDLLSPEFTIVLDDVRRPAERATAQLWRRELGCELELRDEVEIAVLTGSSRGSG